MGSNRVSNVAMNVVAALDPSVQSTLKQWVNLTGRSAEEIEALLNAYSYKTAKSLKDPLDNFASHVDKVIDKAAASLARTGIVPDSSLQQLRIAAELANQMGDSFLKWKAAETLNIAEALRLPEALSLAKQLNSELAHVRESAAAGLAGQARMQSEASAYDSAIFDWADRQEAKRRAGLAGQRLDSRSNAPIALSPAAQAVYQDEARQRAAAAGARLDAYGTPIQAVAVSPAAQAVYRDEMLQHGTAARGRLDAYGAVSPQVALSPAARQVREDEREEKWQHALKEAMFASPGETKRSRIFAEAHRQEQETEQRRVRDAIAQNNREQWAKHVDGQVQKALLREIDRSESPLFADSDIDESVTGGRRVTGSFRRGNRHSNLRMGRSDSHSVRFAAQNVGFGIDDAIQSYHYGGMGASIRAASNNATAIAGMLISNPVTAAASVVAISVASAALPIIMKQFGSAQSFQDMSANDRYNLRTQNASIFNADPAKTYEMHERLAKTTSNAAIYGTLAGQHFSSAAEQMRGDLKRGGSTAFISSLVDKQVTAGGKLKQNEEEMWHLRLAETELRLRSSDWDSTATKELEKNRQRQEAIERENALLAGERTQNTAKLQLAQKLLPSRIAQQAALSAFDRETDMAFNRGDLTLEEHNKRLEARARHQDRLVWAQRDLTPEQQRGASLQIANQLLEDKADPDRERQLRLARINAQIQGHQFNHSQLSQSNYTNAQYQWAQLQNSITRDEIAGILSPEAAQQRRALAGARHGVMSQRAYEDDLTSLNPERNPLRRLNRSVRRQMEDIQGMDLSPEQKREMLLAHLKGSERAAEDAMMPSGTRRFITQGYRVGSMEDEELRARMTGSFGKPESKEKHDSKTLEEIRDALFRLTERLDFQAAQMGV
jgi:hypothetical protein